MYLDLSIFVANVCPCYTFKVVVPCVILDPIVVIIVFEVFVTLFFCLLRSVNRRSPPPLHPWLLAGVVGTLGRLNPRRHFYVCACGLHCTERDESVRLASFGSGWQVPLFSDHKQLVA